MSKQIALPFPESWWIIQARVLAGCTPAAHLDSTTNDRIAALINLNVTLIIDLSPTADTSYTRIFNQLKQQQKSPIRYLPIDLNTKCIPSSSKVKSILDTIDKEVANQGLVYIHCKALRGCTGLISACYLIRNNHTPEQAIQYIGSAQASIPPQYNTMPRTYAQFNLIHDWPQYDPPKIPSPLKTTPTK
ncbi:dual specificity protein phosphatase family protein [Planctomycetota bacterium]|nr:dual specificity protein phosphatase family protein [Planctomycetota bacterium]